MFDASHLIQTQTVAPALAAKSTTAVAARAVADGPVGVVTVGAGVAAGGVVGVVAAVVTGGDVVVVGGGGVTGATGAGGQRLQTVWFDIYGFPHTIHLITCSPRYY